LANRPPIIDPSTIPRDQQAVTIPYSPRQIIKILSPHITKQSITFHTIALAS
jgi:hypothetical protein